VVIRKKKKKGRGSASAAAVAKSVGKFRLRRLGEDSGLYCERAACSFSHTAIPTGKQTEIPAPEASNEKILTW